MEVKDVITLIRQKKNLSEAKASEQAYTMFATVRARHPRLTITDVMVDEQAVTLCLKNGTQVMFDSLLPVPVWKYHRNARGTSFKHGCVSLDKFSDLIKMLEFKSKFAESDEVKREVDDEIAAVLKTCSASSIKELKKRILLAIRAEYDNDEDEYEDHEYDED